MNVSHYNKPRGSAAHRLSCRHLPLSWLVHRHGLNDHGADDRLLQIRIDAEQIAAVRQPVPEKRERGGNLMDREPVRDDQRRPTDSAESAWRHDERK